MADSGYELTEWTVEYDLPTGKTMPAAVTIPHAWRQEVDVRWEGPAIYRFAADLPEDAWLVFEGVSYQARVFVQGEFVGEHRGIWDAFAIDVRKWSGESVVIRVEVIKNGGPTFPVRDVLSGFLPYVFNTFGGIFKPVRVVSSIEEPELGWEEEAMVGWAAASLRALVEAEDSPEDVDFEPPFPPLPLGRGSVNEENTGVGLVGDGDQTAPPKGKERSRIRAEGTLLYVDDKPFYVRGVLTWGWYPELGHTSPDYKTIRKEIEAAKELGFNLIKFCLWLPPHEFLEAMNKAGLFAWIELPLWDPSPDLEKLAAMRDEIERIVLQYRHHPNIAFWTCGCELSGATSAEFRREMVEMVKEIVGPHPLVKDNSGGSEMYGGDPREFGDFDDFHPYCDLQFYPQVLASLAANANKPILLGEFNDYDTVRNLPKLRQESPFWASQDPALNDQGVRWLHDLPQILASPSPCLQGEGGRGVRVSGNPVQRSISKANFIRDRVEDAVFSHDRIIGYVVTGWVDTPISTSGFLDENFDAKGIRLPEGNRGIVAIYPIAHRRPPWIHGGNRTGWQDFANRWVGPTVFRFGVRWLFDAERSVDWTIRGAHGEVIASGWKKAEFGWGVSQVFEFACDLDVPGAYELEIRCMSTFFRRRIFAFNPIDWSQLVCWRVIDRENFFVGLPKGDGPNIIATNWDPSLTKAWHDGAHVVLFATDAMTLPMPFWRECIHESVQSRPWLSYFEEDLWEQILPISTDRALDQAALESALGAKGKVLLKRIDTRTYAEHPFAMEFENGRSRFVVTTLRPFGGLGSCPFGIKNNPAGAHVLAQLLESFQQS